MFSYQLGRILKYRFLLYHVETAGKPNIAISPTKNTRSNTARTINKLPNDGVKSNFPRSLRRNHTLKMFTNTPKTDTLFCY